MSPASTTRIRDGLAVLILVSGLSALTSAPATAAVDVKDDIGVSCSAERTAPGPVYKERPHARYLPLPH